MFDVAVCWSSWLYHYISLLLLSAKGLQQVMSILISTATADIYHEQHKTRLLAEAVQSLQGFRCIASSRSKLSSVCWNSYVKSNLICSDYEGVVQLWDVGQQTETMTFEEHAKRVWSVDFSQVHKLAQFMPFAPALVTGLQAAFHYLCTLVFQTQHA